MTALARRAVRKKTGEGIIFHQPGALKIARLPEHAEQLKSEVARGRRMDTGIEMVSPAEARASVCCVPHPIAWPLIPRARSAPD